METAEKLFEKLWFNYNQKNSDPELHLYLSIEEIELIESAMKQYATMIIEECIKRTFIADNNFHPVITKEDLENIIKEIN